MRYISALDGLRALAVIMVIAFHCQPTVVPGGYIGVDIFFVLSGYLITSNLLLEWQKDNDINIPRFYFRRIKRLAPALYFFLGCYAFMALFSSKSNEHFSAIAYTATYLMNWARAFGWGYETLLGHTWSLAVEQQFYLVWPIVLLGILRFGGYQRATWVVLALLIVAFAWRQLLIWYQFSGNRIYNGFDTRADAILIGCFTAFLTLRRSSWFRIYSVFFIGLLAWFAMRGYWSSNILSWGGAVISVFTAGFVVATTAGGLANWVAVLLSARSMVFIGKISYGMYLWHFPILGIVSRINLNDFAKTGLVFGFTILVASFSYYFIERRFLFRQPLRIDQGQKLSQAA